MRREGNAVRRLAVLTMLGVACIALTDARAQQPDLGAVTLVAAPRLVDPDYRGTVLLAVPVENNRHVGVIINRPTGRSLASLPRARAFEAREGSRLLRRADAAAGGVRGRPHRPHARTRFDPDDEGAVPRDPGLGGRPHHRGYAQRGTLLRGLRRMAAGRAPPGSGSRPVVRARR